MNIEKNNFESKGLNNTKILIVDDEPWNQELMARILAPFGCEIHIAETGAEALVKVEEFNPDAILMDLAMPTMDGFEASRRLKENKSFQMIPIIVITGSEQEDFRLRALDIGVDDFLTKPVNRSELVARLRNHLKLKFYQDKLLQHQKELEDRVAERTQELRKSFEKIKDASLETIHRLTRAAEYRDEDTGDHIQRMSLMAEALARKIGLKESVVEHLLYATPLHDIGKIGVPDRILLKPGKLNQDEWKIMKNHTIFGAKILEGSSISFLRLGEVIAMTHHERWDGSGYPKGLSGKNIPLVGRIVAVVDVFDALTSKRPYKEPFSLERSLSILREGRGSHFDPDVLDAFFDILEQVKDIQQRFKQDGASLLFNISDY